MSRSSGLVHDLPLARDVHRQPRRKWNPRVSYLLSMSTHPSGSRPSRSLRQSASRLGQDAVWLAIAGLFCLVEGAVKLSELPFGRWSRQDLPDSLPPGPRGRLASR